jgi:uncharacterized membrane protein YpjA
MATPSRSTVLGAIRRLTTRDGLPAPADMPRYLAPLPEWLENVGLNIAWLVVLTNLVGTAFGFWYYGFQFSIEPVVMWPFVPDSPVATFFIAASLALWKLGRSNEYVNVLAFFGCLKLGAWTPYVLLAFQQEFSYLHWAMYNFLFWSHLAMVVEAFLIYRYSDFPLPAIGVAVAWYGFNDLVDYFVPIVGTPHHTLIPAEPIVNGVVQHVSPAHEIAAAGAVTLTAIAIVLALATNRAKRRARGG